MKTEHGYSSWTTSRRCLAVVTEALELVGCEVVHAATAEDAFEIIDAREAIDLVLSDVVLPGSRSGVDIVRRAGPRSDMPCC